MRLTLIHRPAGRTDSSPDICLWRTCLRDVVFLADETAAAGTDTETVLTDEDAYALLVEIVSGLRSPLVGETEVQAQFKGFLAGLDPADHAGLLRIGQRVLTDAKLIRSRHLQGIGAHSYGYLASRRVTPGSRVALVGTGALATNVLRALPSGHAIDQWSRSGNRETTPGARQFDLRAASSYPLVHEPTTVIVAAPVTADRLHALLSRYDHVTTVVDLRSADERTPLDGPYSVVTLDDLFTEAAATGHAGVADRLETARREIAAMARAFAQREELRPFGWDDLCA